MNFRELITQFKFYGEIGSVFWTIWVPYNISKLIGLCCIHISNGKFTKIQISKSLIIYSMLMSISYVGKIGWQRIKISKKSNLNFFNLIILDLTWVQIESNAFDYHRINFTVTGLFVMSAVPWFRDNPNHLERENWLPLTTTWIQIFSMDIVSGCTAFITTWLKSHQMKRYLKNILLIDRHLFALGLQTNYVRFKHKLKVQIIFCFFAFYFASMANCAIINDIDATVFKYWGQLRCYHFICIVPMLVNTFKIFQYINCLFLINDKYEKVNRYLLQSMYSKRLNEALTRVSHLQQILYETIEITDNIYGFFNLISLASQFCVVTIQTFNIFIYLTGAMYFHPYEVSLIVLWLFVQMFYIYTYVVTCSLTAANVSCLCCDLRVIKLHVWPMNFSFLNPQYFFEKRWNLV